MTKEINYMEKYNLTEEDGNKLSILVKDIRNENVKEIKTYNLSKRAMNFFLDALLQKN